MPAWYEELSQREYAFAMPRIGPFFERSPFCMNTDELYSYFFRATTRPKSDDGEKE